MIFAKRLLIVPRLVCMPNSIKYVAQLRKYGANKTKKYSLFSVDTSRKTEKKTFLSRKSSNYSFVMFDVSSS